MKGTFTETDVDTNDKHEFSTTDGQGQYGTLTVNKDGSYSFTQNTNIVGMTYINGVYHGKEIFEIKVIDLKGGIDTKYYTIELTSTVSNIPGKGIVVTPGSVGPPGPPLPPAVNVLVPPLPGSVTLPPTPTQQHLTDTRPSSASSHSNTNDVTLDLKDTSDSGTSDSDNLTNFRTPTITGHTTIPFSEVKIYEGHNLIATTRSDKNGHYSVQTHDLGIDNTYHLTATAQEPPPPVQSMVRNHWI